MIDAPVALYQSRYRSGYKWNIYNYFLQRQHREAFLERRPNVFKMKNVVRSNNI
jgi:hypothetical protein